MNTRKEGRKGRKGKETKKNSQQRKNPNPKIKEKKGKMMPCVYRWCTVS